MGDNIFPKFSKYPVTIFRTTESPPNAIWIFIDTVNTNPNILKIGCKLFNKPGSIVINSSIIGVKASANNINISPIFS